MRVIAGLYRGRNLKSPSSPEARPTSDRLRETLFNVLAPRIANAFFLDLCAGTGAIGIEALSRGADRSVFVDRSRQMCDLIEINLDLCRVPARQKKVLRGDAAQYLSARKHFTSDAPYDVIYYDPPYAEDYAKVLELIGAESSDWLAADGLLIAEHYYKNALPDAVGKLKRTRVIKQGDSALSFYAPGEVSSS